MKNTKIENLKSSILLDCRKTPILHLLKYNKDALPIEDVKDIYYLLMQKNKVDKASEFIDYYLQKSKLDDKDIKDKKLKNFVNYLIGCTDYPLFYKMMVRSSKAVRKSDISEVEAISLLSKRSEEESKGSSSRSESKSSPSHHK